MTLGVLNQLEDSEAEAALLRCCGSVTWARRMCALRPFGSPEELYAAATRVWSQLSKEDWLEAFRHHPRIGDMGSLRARFASTASWAGQEQKGVAAATEEVLQALAEGNRDYEARFGHVFLICATGKSAPEMLTALRARLPSSPEAELKTAALEQDKITRIRLEKLLNDPS